jgi:transcriptional regulator with XRE-family HTH domain
MLKARTTAEVNMAKKKTTDFAARLRELRTKAGLSQAVLAERAGLHLHGITKLEQGEREPSWATVQALAAALEVTCEAFTGELRSSGGDAKPSRVRPKKPDQMIAPTAKKRAKKKTD